MTSEFARDADALRERIQNRTVLSQAMTISLKNHNTVHLARLADAAVRSGDGPQTMYMAVKALTAKEARAALERLEREPAAGVDLNLLALRSLLLDHTRGRLREPYGTYLER